MPDPPIFQNDGNPTWEDWYVDMKVKLRSEATWDKDDKKGYVLLRTGKNVRALIQTGVTECHIIYKRAQCKAVGFASWSFAWSSWGGHCSGLTL